MRNSHYLVLFASGLSVWGCVDLGKPDRVQQCTALGTCSDNPDDNIPPVNRDAAIEPDLGPDIWSLPDVVDSPMGTGGTAGPDLGPDRAPDLGGGAGGAIGKDARPGAGGASGSGGTVASGGTIGSGGTMAQGGASGTGGAVKPDAGRDLGPDLGPDTSPPDPLLEGLIAYYPCEAASGTNLPDSSSKNNKGTLSAAAGYSFGTGKVGKALTLVKASSGYVSLPPAMLAGATTMTFAAWVKVTTAQNWQRVLDLGVNANLAQNPSSGTNTIAYMNLVPQTDTSKLELAITKSGYPGEQRLDATSLPANTWKHVALVMAAGSVTLYVDGAQAATGNTVTLRPADLGALDYIFLGRSQFSADPYFDGALDEVRFYNRALTATEVKALFQFTGT
jgi:hypothetical protein